MLLKSSLERTLIAHRLQLILISKAVFRNCFKGVGGGSQVPSNVAGQAEKLHVLKLLREFREGVCVGVRLSQRVNVPPPAPLNASLISINK